MIIIRCCHFTQHQLQLKGGDEVMEFFLLTTLILSFILYRLKLGLMVEMEEKLLEKLK